MFCFTNISIITSDTEQNCPFCVCRLKSFGLKEMDSLFLGGAGSPFGGFQWHGKKQCASWKCGWFAFHAFIMIVTIFV